MDNNPLIRLEDGYKMVNVFDFLLNENILKEIKNDVRVNF